MRHRTSSLKTVRIDPEKLFEFIRPKEPKITKVDVTKVEVGVVRVANYDVLAVLFHASDAIWSIVGSVHGDQKTDDSLFKTLSATLDALGKESMLQGLPCQATVDIHRIGDGPDDLQQTVVFHLAGQTEPKGTSGDESRRFSVSRLSNQNPPIGFRKVQELPLKMGLVIKSHDSK